MDYLTLANLLLIISFVWASILFFNATKSSKPCKLPPGPRPYPIIGNLLELVYSSNNPLQAFTHLSKTYGPIMTLKLGTITTIVISSSEIAKEALQTNDQVFSNRTVPDPVKATDVGKNLMIWLPASTKWRALRRACASKIFSPQQLDSTQFHRQRKVQDLLDYVQECCNKDEALNFGEAIFTTVVNSISNIFLSMDLIDYYASPKYQEFKETMDAVMEESGRPNVANFFPFLGLFDPHGARARIKIHYAKLHAFFDGVFEERLGSRDSKMNSEKCNDVLDSFLDLIKEDSSQLSRSDVLHLFMGLFIAGIDTTSSTLEWAMAELLHKPEKLVKLREELEQLLGQNGQLEESQTSTFPYLRAVVKETLRLHPPAPFLVPHKSNDDAELAGFTVPKNAQILVDVWSIGRDPGIWTNPNSFEPERFLGSEIDFKGKDFEFIPFGAGRRICPGLPLASRNIHFMLASLVHRFNWKLADELKPEDVDMNQEYGLTLHRVQSLRVVPVKV